MVIAFIACKNTDTENKPASGTQTKESPSKIDSTGVIKTKSVTTDTAEDKKLLLDFYKTNEQKPQLFVINTAKDTTLVCAAKTRIKISAKCFVSSKTGADVLDKVQILITEYYTLSDILLAKLSTTTNGNLLETGGMLNITASSNQGKCDLKKGKTIEIGFPRKEEKEGMQLYTGNWSNSIMNWQLSPNTINLNQTFSKVDKQPEFPGGIQKFKNYICNGITLDEDITTKVIASFTIDREGNVINPKIIRGGSKKVNAQIIALLTRSPKFIPGEMNGITVNVYYVLPINIVSDGIAHEIGDDGKKDFRKNFEQHYNNKNLQDAGAGNISYYLFSSSSLGYINCDRLWKNSSAPKIDYAVNFDNNSETNVSIIYHRFKSIMCSSSVTNTVAFSNIPSGEKITIIAIKYYDKKPFLAIKETETSAGGESGLIFKAVTMETLKSEMAKLDRFN